MAQDPRRRAKKPVPQAQVLAAVDAAETAVPPRHLVYIHGICRHVAGYSDPWWAALKPFVPDIADQNRHEVLWSDLITSAARTGLSRQADALTAAIQALHPGVGIQQAAISAQIKDILADRAGRQLIEAGLRTAVAEGAAGEARTPHPILLLEIVGPRALLNIPSLECIDDFARYLLNPTTWDQVMGRFDAVVQPLLQAGVLVEVISHSWGTVVAYEALRRMDATAAQFPSRPVHTFFTLGSALSIPPVKRALLPGAVDGQRPALVQTWVNFNAHFDIVGGALRGDPFEVDYEYLGLAPVGCSAIFVMGLIVSHPSLQTQRPAAVAARTQPWDADNSVPARLWQDPLAAVQPRRRRPFDNSDPRDSVSNTSSIRMSGSLMP
jgi:hypothetical protein